MNRYGTLSDDERVKLINLELSITEQAINIAPAVTEIVKKYDGKHLNKRLETALKKIDKRLYVHNEWNSFDIKFVEHDKRSIQTSNHTEYVEHNDVYIASTCKQSAYSDSSLTDDDRIIADTVISSIDRNVKQKQDHIKEVREQINFIEDYRQDKKTILEAIENHNKINYTVRRYFDLTIER